ncbi:ABC transporter permease subunit [Anoxynatronum sibiricum]|uniref:ABC transporter permease subunit n=1 Tax=Anoxynatronum sibiricum TaxID=210623 RepID=A0ABU9VWY2_9CLOT
MPFKLPGAISLSKIRQVFNKEMRSLFRDKKALLTMFLPVLIYPVIMVFFSGFMMLVQSGLEQQVSRVAVAPSVSAGLVDRLIEEERIEVVPHPREPETALLEKNLEVVVESRQEGAEEVLLLYYHSPTEASQRGMNRVRSQVNAYREDLVAAGLTDAALAENILTVVTIEDVELSEAGESGSRIMATVLGMVVPFLIMLYAIIGTYTLSADVSAGEKERGTLETLFSLPVKRTEIVVGKLLACVAVGMISGLINLMAIFPLLYGIAYQVPDLTISLSPGLLVFLALMLLPVMILTSTLFTGLGLLAHTYQEAQSYGSMLLIVLMLPCYLLLIPDIELTPLTLLIPITNTLLVMREAFLGSYAPGWIAGTLAMNLGVASLGIAVVNRWFQSDRVMFGGDGQ